MVVSVDPKVVPLNSKVLILFSEPEFRKYNGIYAAKDVGGGIKGNRIDLYMGDFKSNKASKIALGFGEQKATLIVLPNNTN
jgi:3D (Asp-Asp-Asp) domain-containing protein